MVLPIADLNREGIPPQFNREEARSIREGLNMGLEDLARIFSPNKNRTKIDLRILQTYENGDRIPYYSGIPNSATVEHKYLEWLAQNGYDPFGILPG